MKVLIAFFVAIKEAEMTKALNVLDSAALVLTGGGVLGGLLAAIDFVLAPPGLLCAAAVGVGFLCSIVVRKFVPTAARGEGDEVDTAAELDFLPDNLRVKTPTTDPFDPSVPGTHNWRVQNDAIAKTF